MRSFNRIPFYVMVVALVVMFVNGIGSKVEVSSRSWGTVTMESNYGRDWKARMAGAFQTNAPLYDTMSAVLENAGASFRKPSTGIVP